MILGLFASTSSTSTSVLGEVYLHPDNDRMIGSIIMLYVHKCHETHNLNPFIEDDIYTNDTYTKAL